MKKFEEPIIDVIDFNSEDVICASTGCDAPNTLSELSVI